MLIERNVESQILLLVELLEQPLQPKFLHGIL